MYNVIYIVNAKQFSKERKTYMENNDKFKLISKLFYEKNFGLATKSEIELMMFYLFISDDSHKQKSNFKVAKELGITEGRVKTLRERCYYLHFPEIDLGKELLKYFENIDQFNEDSFYKKDGAIKVRLNFLDHALQMEFEERLNELNISYDKRFNSKHTEIRVEDLYRVLEETLGEEARSNIKINIENRATMSGSKKFIDFTFEKLKNLEINDLITLCAMAFRA